MTPRAGSGRYEKLAAFLEDVMENPKASKRVRLSAAIRLDDLLRRQERREDAKARRQDRARVEAAKAQHEALEREQQATPDMGRDPAAERALQNLGKILQKSL